MKKILSLLLSASILVACTDYDSQFDQLNQQVEELAAANAALEAQLAAMAALNAQVAQATAAQLAGFQTQVGQITAALTSIVAGLEDLGSASQSIATLVQALTAQVNAINAQIAILTTNIDTLSGDNDALQALLDALTEAIGTISEEVFTLSDQITAQNGDQVVLTGNLTMSRTLVPSIDYYLDGDFTIKAGNALTVPAGTAIVAKTVGSKIVVEKGAVLDVTGTNANPVYFTKLSTVSSWDGIHVYGSAQIVGALIQSSTVGVGLLEEAVSTSRENPKVSNAFSSTFYTTTQVSVTNSVLEDVDTGFLLNSVNHSIDLDNLISKNNNNLFHFSAPPKSFGLSNLYVDNSIATNSIFNFPVDDTFDLSQFTIENITINSTAAYPSLISGIDLDKISLSIKGLTSPVVKIKEGSTLLVTSSSINIDDTSFDSSKTYSSSTLDVDAINSTIGSILDNAGTEDNITTGGHHSGGGSSNGSGSTTEHHSGGGAHHSGGGSTNG